MRGSKVHDRGPEPALRRELSNRQCCTRPRCSACQDGSLVTRPPVKLKFRLRHVRPLDAGRSSADLLRRTPILGRQSPGSRNNSLNLAVPTAIDCDRSSRPPSRYGEGRISGRASASGPRCSRGSTVSMQPRSWRWAMSNHRPPTAILCERSN